MRKTRSAFCAAVIACTAVFSSLPALAADYDFGGTEPAEYYPSYSYASVYGSEYNYGSANPSDYDIPVLPYGVSSNTSIGQMEKVRVINDNASASVVDIYSSPTSGITYLPVSEDIYVADDIWQTDYPVAVPKTAYTSVSGMERSDGSIGIIKISSLGINMKVWEGETMESMAKGIAHYSSTSCWDGNVGVCAHNRGSKYAIGAVKDLKIGDSITYTTVYGTRTYSVSYVGVIANNDWSYLEATADNRITITTCLADHPESRVVVQAVEVR